MKKVHGYRKLRVSVSQNDQQPCKCSVIIKCILALSQWSKKLLNTQN